LAYTHVSSEELQQVEKTYRRIGRRWAYAALSLAAFQGWEGLIRRRAVSRLGLRGGDAALDVACGRGANFSPLVRAVGEEGRVVGVDYSETMLDGARALVARKGWGNVEVTQADAAEMEYESEFDGAISTLGLTVIPRWREALGRMAAAVRPGSRVVVFDGGLGRGLKRVWNPYYRLLARFTSADLSRDVPGECRRLLDEVSEETVLGSNSYIVSGKARGKEAA
jgi:ubiquinone/menaquinone biosynthesis C-methylase UbiE